MKNSTEDTSTEWTSMTAAGPAYDALVIDRDKWLRGGNEPRHVVPYSTCLLNERGDMCPMGFHMQALGFPEHFLLGESEPSELLFDEVGWEEGNGPAFKGRYPERHPQLQPLLHAGDMIDPQTGKAIYLMGNFHDDENAPYRAVEWATTNPALAIIHINDNKAISEEERERLLTQLFDEQFGIALRFTGEAPHDTVIEELADGDHRVIPTEEVVARRERDEA